MNLYKQFKTDKNTEKSGIEIDYGEGVVFTIARAGGANKAFSKALEKETKPFRKAIQHQTLSDKKADEIYKKVWCTTVLLGWENVKDESGKLLEFNLENALKLFNDLPELFNDLKEQSESMALFREVELKEDLGNS